MNWTLADTWIVIIGMLCAGSCALLGNFLVLRRMSMMGDAISHAVLPGLAVAFWLTGKRSSFEMFAGAAAAGVLTAVFTQWVHSFGKVDRGASMGVVFTTLFAVGLIMIDQWGKHADLDASCVLYGMIDLAPFDTIDLMGRPVPRAAVVLGGMFIVNALTIALFYKEFKITSFDPALATTLGINATFMHYLLMVLVAVTTVASFEAIGSILVIAMLIVPAATAYIMTQRLGAMIAASLIVGALSAALGHVAAIVVPPVFGFEDTTTAGMMATTAGFIFTLVLLVAPKQGLITRLVERRRLSGRIVREDILGLLYRAEEQRPAGAAGGMTMQQFDRALEPNLGKVQRAAAQLVREGKIDKTGESYALADAGRAEAQDMIRAHRLWESYLEQNLPLPVDHLHAPAEKLEHITDDAMRKKLAEATANPETDPQGKKVPR